jgi:hypothetical protein
MIISSGYVITSIFCPVSNPSAAIQYPFRVMAGGCVKFR